MVSMFHSIRFLRAQLMASELTEPGVQLMSDLALNPFRAPLARAQSLQRACQMVCQMHGLTIRLAGNLPTEPAIYVSNHMGYVDPVAICSVTPCSPIAKSEVASWPCIGALARRMNVIFVQRGNTASATRALRLAMHRLEAGVSVLNFPEGTTTRGDMLQFRRGIFGLSALMKVPVVPLALSFDELGLCWVDDDSLIGHYSTALLGRSHFVDLQAGPPMFIRPSETPAEFAARVRGWILSARSAHGSRRPSPPTVKAPLPSRSWPHVAALADDSAA